jgi:negative regulator of flagellin synthesis FlgM
MTTINDATSSAPLQPANSPINKQNTGPASGTSSTGSTASTASTSGASSTGNAASTNSSSTVTTLSTISTQLQAAQAASSTDGVFSTDKVNQIKQAISEGRFQVNSEKVADGLLDGVRDLLSTRQRG